MCVCVCVWAFVFMCSKCTGGFCVLCVCVVFCGVKAYQHLCVYVCANLSGCTPRHFSCLLLAVLHTSISTFLRGFFAVSCQRIFSHSGWQTPASHASLSPTDYGEIKTCSLASQKFIMSVTVLEVFVTDDVISRSVHGCELNILATMHAQCHCWCSGTPTMFDPNPVWI